MGNGLHQRLSESEGKLRREQVERTAGVEGRTQQTENVQRRTSNGVNGMNDMAGEATR